MNEISTTINGILDRRVQLEQPADGYRVAVDTVLLAAAVPALSEDNILDLGCGVGGAMLCLACRVAGVKGLGLEIQGELAELCRRNIERNKTFAAGLDVRLADVNLLPDDLRGAFDHALMNPPYHDERSHSVSENSSKRTANSEVFGDLNLWIRSAALALKDLGSVSIIHRADRCDEIMSLLEAAAFGCVEIFPILPRQGCDPKRVIVRARKNSAFGVLERRPLVLHNDVGGGYTDAAEDVLRRCQGLPV